MNITKVEKEQGAALLRIVVEEADYAAEVEKMLREYKRKANIPGFRQGMVPMGVIKKMYGKVPLQSRLTARLRTLHSSICRTRRSTTSAM